MKRRILMLLMIGVLIFSLLAGCSGEISSAPNVNGGMSGDSYDSNESLNGALGESNSNNGVLTDRKLIRRISVSAETEDMDVLLSEVTARVSQLNGYIESRNIQNGSNYGYGYRSRSATLVIRIPAEHLDSFLQQVSDRTNVVSIVENSDDVTLEYAATESRLKVLRTEETRLLEFLADAKTVSEMLEIEKRLTQVQSEIESITTQLNTYDNLVDYGTVTLSVTEVEVYTEIPTEQPTVWQRIGKQFKANLEALLEIGEGLLVFFIGNSPALILLGLIGGGIAWLIIRKRKK